MTKASFNSTVLGIDATQIFSSLAALAAYIFAGKATFTVYSEASGERYTFKVKAQRGKDKKVDHKNGPWFVTARNGSSFQHLGVIKIYRGQPRFFQDTWKNVKGKYIACLPQSHRARYCFQDLYDMIQASKEMPQGVVAWHHNECGRCAIPLTSDFRHLGYGRTCCGHMGIDHRYIFSLLKDAVDMEESERVDKMREMAYRGLTSDEGLFAKLLPGVAGQYGQHHFSCQRVARS